MQTTLRINDHIYKRAKSKSGELGVSLTRFFEESVEKRLDELEQISTSTIVLPVSSRNASPMKTEDFLCKLDHLAVEEDLEKINVSPRQ